MTFLKVMLHNLYSKEHGFNSIKCSLKQAQVVTGHILRLMVCLSLLSHSIIRLHNGLALQRAGCNMNFSSL